MGDFEAEIRRDLYRGLTKKEIIDTYKALLRFPVNKEYHKQQLEYTLRNINRIVGELKRKPRMKGGMAKETPEGRTNTEFYETRIKERKVIHDGEERKGEEKVDEEPPELINIQLTELPDKLRESDFTPDEQLNLIMSETADIIKRNNDIIANENNEVIDDTEIETRQKELIDGLNAFKKYIPEIIKKTEIRTKNKEIKFYNNMLTTIKNKIIENFPLSSEQRKKKDFPYNANKIPISVGDLSRTYSNNLYMKKLDDYIEKSKDLNPDINADIKIGNEINDIVNKKMEKLKNLDKNEGEPAPLFNILKRNVDSVEPDIQQANFLRGNLFETIMTKNPEILQAIDDDNSQVYNTKTWRGLNPDFKQKINRFFTGNIPDRMKDNPEDSDKSKVKDILDKIPIDLVKGKTIWELKSWSLIGPKNKETYKDFYTDTKLKGTKNTNYGINDDYANKREIKYTFKYIVSNNNVLSEKSYNEITMNDKVLGVKNIDVQITYYNQNDREQQYVNTKLLNPSTSPEGYFDYYLLESTPKKIRYIKPLKIISDIKAHNKKNVTTDIYIPQNKYRNIPKSYENMIFPPASNIKKHINAKEFIRERTK